MKSRIYYLDNLRTFLIFLVVVVHCGLVYEAVLEKSWIVVDSDKANGIGLVRMYIDIFVMFALFFVSGYFLPGSLHGKKLLSFIKSKARRIMLPWLVAVVTMIPAYKYIFLYSRGLPQEEWFSYFHIFYRTGGDPFFFADNPVMNWLWFLPILFVFQIVYSLLERMGLVLQKVTLRQAVGGIIVFSVAYSLLISAMEMNGWHHSALFHFQRERLLGYFLVFWFGGYCYEKGILISFQKNLRQYIWINVALTLSLGIFTAVALNLFFNAVDPSRNYFFISPWTDRLIYYFTLMTSMLTFLYILVYNFRLYLDKTGRLAQEMSGNSYFVYIIHVVVLGILAIPLLNAGIPVVLKYFILTISTFVVSNILVSLYRRSLQKFLSHRMVMVLFLILTTLLTAVVYRQQHQLLGVSRPDNSERGKENLIPEMGLHEAALSGNVEVIQRHIDAGSDIEIKDQATGNSPLHSAVSFGQREAARMLIAAGADVNYLNSEGSTPLHSAAFFCHREIVELLLLHGADRGVRNRNGLTALDNVSGPFATVRPIYEYCEKTYGPLGMQIDYDFLEKERPQIAEILRQE